MPGLTGSADADFILDGLLLNGKAITAPARLGRDEISQLAATFCSITTKSSVSTASARTSPDKAP